MLARDLTPRRDAHASVSGRRLLDEGALFNSRDRNDAVRRQRVLIECSSVKTRSHIAIDRRMYFVLLGSVAIEPLGRSPGQPDPFNLHPSGVDCHARAELGDEP